MKHLGKGSGLASLSCMSDQASTSDTSANVPRHRYDAARADAIETHWQAKWRSDGTYNAPNPTGPLSIGHGRQAILAHGRVPVSGNC